MTSLIAVVLLLAFVLPVSAQEQSLNAQLEQIRSAKGLPAVAAAVVKNGAIVASGVVGTRVQGMNIPATIDDRFHIGSDTKAMTATLAGLLVDQGKLRWNSTIGEVFGPDMPGLNAKFAAITLEQLLSHTSGIPSDDKDIIDLYFSPDGYNYPPRDYRRRIIQQWGSRHEPKVPDGSPFQYANLGYVAVGAMIEKAAGEPWEILITRHIFEALGLKSAGLGPQATFGRYDAPVGHSMDGGKIAPMPWGPSADAPAVIGPAGIVHLSIRDFARWGAWNAGQGRRGPTLVKPETLQKIHSVHVRTPVIVNPKPGTPKTGEYGFGWGIAKFDWTDKPVLTHNGSNSLNFATILVEPEIDLVIVVATNLPGETADAAALQAMATLYRQFAGVR